MDVKIRQGEPGDVEAVLQLMSELAEHEGLRQYLTVTGMMLQELCFGQAPRVELIIAEVETKIVGYATCLVQLSIWMGCEYLFLDDLYVSDEVRGKGVGSALMKGVGARALERGVGVRWHVELENRAAQKFYRSLGAQLKEKMIAYWEEAAIRACV